MISEKSWLKYKDIFDELNIKLHLVTRFCYKISTTQTIDKIKQLLRLLFRTVFHIFYGCFFKSTLSALR